MKISEKKWEFPTDDLVGGTAPLPPIVMPLMVPFPIEVDYQKADWWRYNHQKEHGILEYNTQLK